MASLGQEDLKNLAEQVLRGVEFNGQPLGPDVPFDPLTAPEFYARPIPPLEELLGPLIIRGQRFVIGAGTGEGKSTMAWWIVKALATGGKFLDWKASRPCRVLVVDAEQTEHDLKRLLVETHLQDCANITILHVPDGLSLNTSEEQRMKLELLLDQGQFDVVLLDPYYKLHTGNANDEQQTASLMRLFDSWRTRFNFALMIPSHTRKQSNDKNKDPFSIDDIFGAGVFLRGAEVVVGLKLLGEGTSNLHFFKRRSPGLPIRTHWPLRFSREVGYTLLETPLQRTQRVDEADDTRILDLLMVAGGAGVPMQVLVDGIGKSRDTVERILKRLNAVARPMPGQRHRKLWFLGGVEADEATMDAMGGYEDDD